MVALPETLKTEDVITTPSNNVKVPDATYIGVIVKSEMSKSPFGNDKPDDLVLTVVITQGDYKDTVFEHRLGILDERPIKQDNPTFTWAVAARRNLGQIAKAFNIEEFNDTDMFHNKPLAFTTATRKGKDKETGAHKPEWDQSYIKQYKAVPANGVPTPAPAAEAAPVAATGEAAPANPFAAS